MCGPAGTLARRAIPVTMALASAHRGVGGGEGGELGEGAAAEAAAGEAVEDGGHGGEVVLAEAELGHVHEDHGPAARVAQDMAGDEGRAADGVHAEGVAQRERVALLLQHSQHRVAAPPVRRPEPLDPRGFPAAGDAGVDFVDLAIASMERNLEVFG